MILILISPILCLLVCLLGLKMPGKKASALAFLIAVVVYHFYYNSGFLGLYISMAKGFGLALFVVLIIWGAMFLYSLVKESGALDVINKNIQIIVKNRFLQFLLLSWVFASFLQGIAGFGVPVIVVAPILVGMGFNPVVSAAAVLVGHSWAISYGSMGSSIYAINMVTSEEIGEIVNHMFAYGLVAMLCTGLSVCFIYGGKKYLIKGVPYVLATTITMGVTLYIVSKLEMLSIIGISTGLVGLITLFTINKLSNRTQEKITLFKSEINLAQALMPYILIVILSLAFYVIHPTWAIYLNYPGYETLAGVVVEPANQYVKFNILKFPFSVIAIASAISIIMYRRKGVFDKSKLKKVINATIDKCMSATVTLIFLLSMAVIMMDSGMIHQLAVVIVGATNEWYPFASPFIGLLGYFVTGSNTNSNVIFGSLQETAANTLGLSAAAMCAAQSIGASIGGGIGPTTVSLGSTAAQIHGQESLIYKKTLIPILLTALILGIQNLIIVLY